MVMVVFFNAVPQFKKKERKGDKKWMNNENEIKINT